MTNRSLSYIKKDQDNFCLDLLPFIRENANKKWLEPLIRMKDWCHLLMVHGKDLSSLAPYFSYND